MLRLSKHIAHLFLLSLLFVGSAIAAQPLWQVLPETINKSVSDPREYKAIKLNNDMTVLLVSDPKATKSLAAVSLPVGSIENPDSQLGLAHYLEHMVLMGSKKYPEPSSFSEFLQKHGGSHNASTAPHRTAYYFEVENGALEAATDRLADALAEPLLDPINADKERNAVNAELTMARARDGMRIWQIRSETLNPAHPNSRFAGGNLETLKDKKNSKLQDELVSFYKRYYSANLMNGVLYGDQSIEQLAKIANETFGRIPNFNASVPEVTIPAVTDKEKGIVIHYVPSQPQKALQIEFSIKNNMADFRSKSDEYISYLIGNRSPGTLSDWLISQGLAEGISASASPNSDRNYGSFSIYVTLTDKGLAERDQIIAAIFAYIDLIKNQGVNQGYFDEIAKVLNLSFRYGSIVRDMNYIEWLSDQMITMPVNHVLDSDYVADKYNPAAIKQRLSELTAQNARIWFISPNEPSNKKAYFVDAPYQVDKISKKQFTQWADLESKMTFKLPKLNPYIPDNLSLIKTDKAYKHPEMVYQEGNTRVLYMPSQYFADEPKASITLDLRYNEQDKTAKSQVAGSLLQYISSLKMDELQYQASVAGMSVSVSQGVGLQLNASGYTQHLSELFLSMTKQYLSFEPTERELAQAKSWYKEQIEVANNAKAYELAMQPLQRLNSVPYFEQEQRLAALETITLKDITDYRDSVVEGAALQALVVGNLTQQQSIQTILDASKLLKSKGKNWWRGDIVVVDKTYLANFHKQGNSSDNALAELFIPTGYDRIDGAVLSGILSKIVQPWFYDQLRTNEQLGYAVFAFKVGLGDQWGIGFLLQSNAKTPNYLNTRYQDFYTAALDKLKKLPASEFEQYKQSIITEMKQPPQTFYEEVGRYGSDFSRNIFSFDTRDKLLTRLAAATQAEVINYYENAVLKRQGLAMASQVIGQNVDTKSGYAQFKNWALYLNASDLQKKLPIKENAE
ncbi:TPA: pitrilysin [Providencia alcalifaciens]|uniref:Protease 3 n=3 Tax=Providencia alcalifaciens TaxID=126385 RepID=A0AAW9VCV9_9GAMM|nr:MULTISPECIES: pitrilysin [Providencia]ATG16281.1 pitrilysin [Providencia alcalifaciens]EEB45913.1 peptidase, M16 family [Providencia alcalifaciens DSM 30120]ETT04250.1 protease 3 [Providencia alcalifaciens F90-2004]EUC95956.1 protease 3 [Providencia alcalifaciens PAL-2]EUD10333.1 protease 3 [Providencia alcalifaciens 205/92]